MQIKRAAVLGAGVMGATIAAHLANAGLEVLLLDMVPAELNDAEKAKGLTLESPAVRSRIAAAGLDAAIKGRGLYHKSYAGQIEVGNFEDDIAGIRDCDWVIEVVLENMEVKRKVFAEMVVPNLREGAILSTEQLLEEIDRSGREIRKGKRLMLIGSDVHNSAWIEAIEELDAVVVTDELYSGTRYFWGEVDTTLPPMEALARYYMFVRPPEPRIWPSGGRFQHIFEMAEQYKVDGGISEIITFCAFPNHDKLILKDQMTQRGIPMLELDLEYGQGGSGQFRIRAEAFLEMLQNRAQQ